jgi:PAS domain S-box-containing protein
MHLDALRGRLAAGETARLEVGLAHGAGPPRSIDAIVQPVPAIGYVAVLTDVTERRRAELALAESEDRYRRLVESCPEPIVVHSGGRIRFINPAGVGLLGAESAEDLLGRPIMDFVHADFHAIVAERVRKMEDTGEPGYRLEEKILRLDGSVVEVEVAGARVLFQGEPAIQLVGRDLTHRKRAEEERRRHADRVRETRRRESLFVLAEGVAHQLSELSSTIVESADHALAQGAEGARASSFAAIRRAGLRIRALTEQLLAFIGKRRAIARPVDLSALVMEISDRLEGEVGAGVALTFDLPARLPRALLDAVQVRRVAIGLARNAADALGERGGTIVVRTGAADVHEERLARVQPPDTLAPGRYVLLEVRDAGCGMDAETRARILEPFFTTKSPGRGLGLSEVLGLVRAQGGGLEIESEPGRGTRVTVLFPVPPPVASLDRRRSRARRRL